MSNLGRQAEDRYERERIRYQWMLESIHKFRLFFVGLVFSILAFSVQFSIETKDICVNLAQVSAWLTLLFCGVLALKEAGGFNLIHHDNSFDGLDKKLRIVMWSSFLLGLLLLMVARVLNQT